MVEPEAVDQRGHGGVHIFQIVVDGDLGGIFPEDVIFFHLEKVDPCPGMVAHRCHHHPVGELFSRDSKGFVPQKEAGFRHVPDIFGAAAPLDGVDEFAFHLFAEDAPESSTQRVDRDLEPG